MEYILYDVNKIKDYVFDSHRPREVKGASEFIKALDYDPKSKKKNPLLHQLMDRFPEIKDESIIYSKGGTGLILSSLDNGNEICNWLEEEFSNYTRGASLTAVFHKEESSFPITYDILNFKAREKKMEKMVSNKLEIIEFEKEETDRCGACGKRIGFHTVDLVDETILYCDSCYAKRTAPIKTEKKDTDAETLEDICKVAGLPENKYILTIYGDLNEAGNHLSSIQNKSDLKTFSEGIFETLEQTRNEIESELEPNGFKLLAPVTGGDDLILFTHPAAFSLIFEKLCKIESSLNQRLGKNLKMNFAFLLCKYNFPIYHIFQLSQSLLEKTKDIYYNNKKEEKDNGSYYGLFKVQEGGHRPTLEDVYPAEEFMALFDIGKRLAKDKKIHTSALFNLLESISPEPMQEEKEINVLYFLARHSEFKDYINNAAPDFNLIHKGKDIKLSPATLEDVIMMMRDLTFKFDNLEKEVQ